MAHYHLYSKSKGLAKRLVSGLMAFLFMTGASLAALPLAVEPVMATGSNLVINEFLLATGNNQKWVEIYNPTNQAVDISNWRITRQGSRVSPVFSDGLIIQPGGFYVWSTTSSLSPNPSTLALVDGPNGSVIDSVDYPQLDNQTVYARHSDAGLPWRALPISQATPGASNNPAANPTVATTNFNTHSGSDYKGINVGFLLNDDFGEVSSVRVELYQDQRLLVANSHSPALLDLINNGEKSHSTPFIIQAGDYQELYWQLGEYNWTRHDKPTRAQISVVDQTGNYTAQNLDLSEANVSFESLFPVSLDDFPSTNDTNRSHNRPHVNLVSASDDSITLEFINQTSSQAFFEPRIDGATPTTGNSHPNPCKLSADPLPTACGGRRYLADTELVYPGGINVDNRPGSEVSRVVRTFAAQELVEIRLALGGERDWDFDWVRFETEATPDTTRPAIEIIDPAADSPHSRNVTIKVQAQDQQSGLGQFVINISKDGAHLASCHNQHYGGSQAKEIAKCSFNLTGRDDGIYQIRTNARDLAGNISATLTRNFIVDQTDAITQIEAPVRDQVLAGIYRFSGTAQDNLSGVDRVYLRIGTQVGNQAVFGDWVEFDHHTGQWQLEVDTSQIPDGLYNVRVRAIDRAGNDGVSGMHVLRDFEVDNTAPTAPKITSPNGTERQSSPVTLAWTAPDEDIAYFTYKIQKRGDQTSYHQTTDRTINLELAPGVYDWQVQAVDRAGNHSDWSHGPSFTVIRSIPNLRSSSLTPVNPNPPANYSGLNQALSQASQVSTLTPVANSAVNRSTNLRVRPTTIKTNHYQEMAIVLTTSLLAITLLTTVAGSNSSSATRP